MDYKKKECNVSVIVPIYNCELYLGKCIDSLLRQTLSDIERILVDDGSIDNSGAICDAYAEMDERIVVCHQKNAGVAAARNAGIRLAQSRYVMFVDGDDWVEQDFCLLPFSLANTNDLDIVMFEFVTIKGKKDVKPIQCEEGVFYSQEKALYLLTGTIQNYVTNKLFRKTLFEDSPFSEGIIYEDIEIMYKLILSAHSFGYINNSLYNYVLREGSITKTINENNFTSLFRSHYNKYVFIKDAGFDVFKAVDLYGLCRAALLYRIYIGSNKELSGKADLVLHEYGEVFRGRFNRKRQKLLSLYFASRPLFDLICTLSGKRV